MRFLYKKKRISCIGYQRCKSCHCPLARARVVVTGAGGAVLGWQQCCQPEWCTAITFERRTKLGCVH